jgi:hypothetical protein
MSGMQVHNRCRSLIVFSDDSVVEEVVAADDDKEEDDMVTYRQRWRAVCLTWARSPVERGQKGASKRRKVLGFL